MKQFGHRIDFEQEGIVPLVRLDLLLARGHDLLKTAADPHGVQSLGTWNNCGSGRTPWGTYLACEENFNGYFSSSDDTLELNADQVRYGINHRDWGYNWASADDRFDIAKHPNEPNRAGYVVEIDPMDPASMPKKRTALGRFKHAMDPEQVAKQVEFYKNKEDIVFEEDEGSEPMDLSEDVVDAETKAQSNYSSF